MNVRIAIPVKYKLDAQAVRRGRSGISQATSSAIDRILVNAERELADRGGLERVQLAPITFDWKGAGLSQLREEDRNALEADLRAVIDKAVERAINAVAPNAPEVLAHGEGVPFNQDMLVGGVYVVDSYDTSGEDGTPAAPTRREGLQFIDTGEEWVPQDGSPYRADLYQFISTGDLRRAIRTVLQEAIDQNAAPAPGRVGFVYSGHDELGRSMARTAVIDFNGSAESVTIVDHFNFPGVQSFTPQVDDSEKVEISTQPLSSNIVGVTTVTKIAGEATAIETLTDQLWQRVETNAQEELRQRNVRMTPQIRQILRNAVGRFAENNILEMQNLNPERRLILAQVRPPGQNGFPAALPSRPFGGRDTMSVIHMLYVHREEEEEAEGEGIGTGAAQARGGGGAGGRGSNEGGGQGRGEGGAGGRGSNEAGDGDGDGDGDGNSRPQPFRFPAPTISNPGATLTCEPFHGEASVEELGSDGRRLKSLIGRIAWRLQMPECKYPAQFLLNAGKVWGGRAAQAKGFAGERSATIRATENDQARVGGLGDIGFEPTPSPVLDTIKHLGGTIPLMTELLEAIHSTYRDPVNAAKLSGHSQNNGAHFSYTLQTEYVFDIQDSIGYGYKVACQSVLIQLCLASRQQILERLNNFENYWPIFDSVLRTLVAEESELRLLRERLESHISTSSDVDMQSVVSRGVDNWRNARRNVISLFSSSSSSAILESAQDRVGDATTEGDVRKEGEQWIIRDRNGKDWTREELRRAIGVRATQGREIDPLLSKLTDLPDVRRIAEEAPADAKRYIRALLMEMLEDNEEVTREVEADAHHAFTRGQISEDLVNPTVPGINVQLGGIHLTAHEAIYSSFRGDPYYESALRKIFGLEVGKSELLAVVEFVAMVGIVAASVLCPPVGLAAGAVMAGINYGVAHENAEVVNALFNPEQLTSSANAELELFMAEIEVVMSVIPFAGKALGATARGAKTAFQQGVRQAGRSAFRGMTRELASQIGENMRRGLLRQILQEIIQEQVSGKLMEQMLAPVLQSVVDELELAHGRAGGNAAPPPPDQQIGNDPGTVERRSLIIERKLDEAGGNIENNSEGVDSQRGSSDP